jgi:hypothetical protein
MNDFLSFSYSVYALRARFILGEPTIKDSPMVWAMYVKKFPDAQV